MASLCFTKPQLETSYKLRTRIVIVWLRERVFPCLGNRSSLSSQATIYLGISLEMRIVEKLNALHKAQGIFDIKS